MHVNRKGIEVQQPLQETELNIHRKGFIIPKLFQVIKVKTIKHFCFQAFNFALKKGSSVRQLSRRLSPARITVVSFCTKYVVLRRIKHKKRPKQRVVSVGLLGFDYRRNAILGYYSSCGDLSLTCDLSL